jgi:hypothetical protein
MSGSASAPSYHGRDADGIHNPLPASSGVKEEEVNVTFDDLVAAINYRKMLVAQKDAEIQLLRDEKVAADAKMQELTTQLATSNSDTQIVQVRYEQAYRAAGQAIHLIARRDKEIMKKDKELGQYKDLLQFVEYSN